MAVAAVRWAGRPRRVVGSTFPVPTVTEAEAREVVRAFGGAERLRQGDVTRAKTPPPAKAFGGSLDPHELASFLSAQYRVPTIDLEAFVVAPEILGLVSRAICLAHTVLPVSRSGDSLVAAVVDPGDAPAVEALARASGLRVEPVLASDSAIRTAIDRHYPAER